MCKGCESQVKTYKNYLSILKSLISSGEICLSGVCQSGERLVKTIIGRSGEIIFSLKSTRTPNARVSKKLSNVAS